MSPGSCGKYLCGVKVTQRTSEREMVAMCSDPFSKQNIQILQDTKIKHDQTLTVDNFAAEE